MHVTIEHRDCSGPSRSLSRALRWPPMPGRAAVPPRWSSCSPSPRAAGCTASRSSTRSGRGSTVERPRSAAAQGGPLRAAGAGRRPGTAVVLAQRPVCCCPTPTCASTPIEFRGARREGPRRGTRREAPRPRWPTYGGRCCPRTSTSPGPPSARDTVRSCTATCCGWPGGGRTWCARTRPTRRRTWRWPGEHADAGRRTRRAAPARADGAGAAARARHRAQWRGARGCGRSCDRSRPARRAEPRDRAVTAGRAQGGRRHGARPPGRADAGRGSTLLLTGPAGVGKSAVLDLAVALAGSVAGAPGGARRRRWRAPGRTPRCSRRSATSAGSTRRCSTGWTTASGSSSTARCPGSDVDVERRDRAPAAVRRGGGAAAAGRQRPRAAARRRRRARGRRGVAAAAALPGPDRRHRAGADRAGPPAARSARARCDDSLVARGAGARDRPPDRSTRPRTRRLLARPPPRPRRGDGRARSVRCRGGLPFRILEAGPRPARRADAGDLAVLAPAGAAVGDPPAGRAARARRSPPTSCSRSAGSTRTRPTPRSAAALARSSSSPRRPATGSVTPWSGSAVLDDLRAARAGVPRRREVAERLAALGAPADPGRPPLPRLRPAVAGHPARAPGRRDRGRAGCLPRRAGPGRRRVGPRLRRRPCPPAGAARRPAARARRPGRGAGVPRGRRRDHRHRAPAGPRPAGPGGHLRRRPGHRARGARRARARGRRGRRAAPAGPGQPRLLHAATSTRAYAAADAARAVLSPTTRGRSST